jgi:hypothetical protein
MPARRYVDAIAINLSLFIGSPSFWVEA